MEAVRIRILVARLMYSASVWQKDLQIVRSIPFTVYSDTDMSNRVTTTPNNVNCKCNVKGLNNLKLCRKVGPYHSNSSSLNQNRQISITITNIYTRIGFKIYLSRANYVVPWPQHTWCSKRLCLPVILALVGLQINKR